MEGKGLIKDLLRDIIAETKYLNTTDEASIPCISIENLSGILKARRIITEAEARELVNETA